MKSQLLLLFTLISLTGCTQSITGTGDYTTQTREVQAFTEVDLALPARVTVRQGASYKVEIKAQANVLEVIDTKISGKELTISTKKYVKGGKNVEITITMPKLEGFEVNGSGTVTSPDVFESAKVDLEINGSGEFKGNFVSEEIKSEISGSGRVELTGSAKQFEHTTNGSGNLEAANLRAKAVKVDINGSGNASLWADEALETEINGSGSITYKGAPSKVAQEINGSGTVRKI